ncbi:MAG TPA: hypothetical protein VF845_09900 [Terriglobales bacterium]
MKLEKLQKRCAEVKLAVDEVGSTLVVIALAVSCVIHEITQIVKSLF